MKNLLKAAGAAMLGFSVVAGVAALSIGETLRPMSEQEKSRLTVPDVCHGDMSDPKAATMCTLNLAPLAQTYGQSLVNKLRIYMLMERVRGMDMDDIREAYDTIHDDCITLQKTGIENLRNENDPDDALETVTMMSLSMEKCFFFADHGVLRQIDPGLLDVSRKLEHANLRAKYGLGVNEDPDSRAFLPDDLNLGPEPF